MQWCNGSGMDTRLTIKFELSRHASSTHLHNVHKALRKQLFERRFKKLHICGKSGGSGCGGKEG